MQISDLQEFKIYTIGHGNRKIENFTNLLIANNIEILVDVRSIPYSRFHPQFRQLNLKDSLKNAGIEYLFLGKELGGRPTDPALYLNGKVNYDIIKETEIFKTGIGQVIRLAEQKVKVNLMCSEADQNECHRKCLISKELLRKNIEVLHINKFGNIEIEAEGVNRSLFNE